MVVEKYIVPILRSYSAVLFNSEAYGGALLLFLSFLNPNVGFGGLVSLLSAYLFARLLGFKKEFLRIDYYIYNPLLVGLSLGYIFKINTISFLFFLTGGILSFLTTYVLSNLFYYYFRLPILSLPFVIVSSTLYLASQHFSNLFVESLYPHFYLPNIDFTPFINGFFKSLGAVFFLPNTFCGSVIFLLILRISPILAFLSVIGYSTGILTTALFKGSLYQAISDTSAFNYILTSMAVGGVFLVPSLRSYKFALLSSFISVPIVESSKVFWETYGIPVFALPFNVVSLLVLYVFIFTGYSLVTRVYRGTPERTLDYYLTRLKRFPFTGREIALPFSGEWTVWQSFDGEWTHKGAWRHAVDFVITDSEGKTFKGTGSSLSDYYCFGKPVLSPIDGTVVEVVSSLPDNKPGEVDKENNWGNYVLLYDKRGFYVLVCHLKQNSVNVKRGDSVTKGSLLGLCGNSGYSPQPHIHIHVQVLPHLGAPTVPFSFTSFISSKNFHDVGIPKKGERVTPVFADKSLFRRLNFLIGQEFTYSLYDKKRGEEETLKIQVEMAPDGTFYFTEGRSKLYFGILNSTFYFYSIDGDLSSPLKYFLFSAPKIPLINSGGVVWRDYLPLTSLFSEFKRKLLLFISSFKHDLLEVRVKSCWSSIDTVSTEIILPGSKKVKKAKLKLSNHLGFEEINYNNEVILRRVKNEENVINS